jgi:hypothetical protein
MGGSIRSPVPALRSRPELPSDQPLSRTRLAITCEAFFNQYSVVVILAETGRIPLGKRIVVARAIATQAGAARR